VVAVRQSMLADHADRGSVANRYRTTAPGTRGFGARRAHLGAVMALLASIVHALDVTFTAAGDRRGRRPARCDRRQWCARIQAPFFLRQVNEDWLASTASGSTGAVAGRWAGVATYIMTAGFVTIAPGVGSESDRRTRARRCVRLGPRIDGVPHRPHTTAELLRSTARSTRSVNRCGAVIGPARGQRDAVGPRAIVAALVAAVVAGGVLFLSRLRTVGRRRLIDLVAIVSLAEPGRDAAEIVVVVVPRLGDRSRGRSACRPTPSCSPPTSMTSHLPGRITRRWRRRPAARG
jgi:hypothetical protein